MVQDLSNSHFCWHNFNKRFYVKCGLENMTPSFRDRLREILNNLELDDDGACGDPECCGLPSYHISHESKDKALAEILSLVRGIIPDEEPEPYEGDCDWQLELAEKSGHDRCRQAILNEIGDGDATRKHDGGL